MKWITRERPKIDRIACPWAIPYDIPGVELSHVGDLCSFDAFLRKCGPSEPARQQLAVIDRGADTSHLDLAPQSPGLYRELQDEAHRWPPEMNWPWGMR